MAESYPGLKVGNTSVFPRRTYRSSSALDTLWVSNPPKLTPKSAVRWPLYRSARRLWVHQRPSQIPVFVCSGETPRKTVWPRGRTPNSVTSDSSKEVTMTSPFQRVLRHIGNGQRVATDRVICGPLPSQSPQCLIHARYMVRTETKRKPLFGLHLINQNFLQFPGCPDACRPRWPRRAPADVAAQQYR